MNMISSLKAMLFASTAKPVPGGEGAAGSAMAVDGMPDFAKLLTGRMAPSPDAVATGEAAPAIEEDAAQLVARTSDQGEGASALPEPAATLPPGLANALQAIQAHRKETLPLPPGVAAKVEAAGAAGTAVAPKAQPAEATADAGEVEAATPVEASEAPAEGVVEESAQVADTAPAGGATSGQPGVRAHGAPKVAHPVQKSFPAKAREELSPPATDKGDDRIKTEDGESVGPVQPVAAAPVAVILPVAAPEAASVQQQPAEPSASAPEIAGAPKRAVPAPPAPVVTEAASPPERAVAAVKTEAAAPRTAEQNVPAAAAPDNNGEGGAAQPTVKTQPPKAEALALLQMVRDQVAARQPDAPVRVGEQVSAIARSKSGRGGAVADAAPLPTAQPQPADTAPQSAAAQPVLPPASQTAVATPPGADLSASLGAQVVDMGVSGQWIDGLARDIAGLSANGAQGRFQINSEHLGAVQVDIRHGDDGAIVNLTVASEAAEMALRQDSDRLKLDAGMAAVRISDVKIERAPHIAEAARAESGGQQGSQQGSQQYGQQAAQHGWSNGQNMGQSQGQGQGRWRSQENGAFAPKNSSDPAVLNHAEARHDAGGSRRARYA